MYKWSQVKSNNHIELLNLLVKKVSNEQKKNCVYRRGQANITFVIGSHKETLNEKNLAA